MTHIQDVRRYYGDSYRTKFESRVVDLLTDQPKPGVVLAETYFYPTSGGQPNDLGRLNGAAVVDVTVREVDGAIVHWLDRPVSLGPVLAEIDGARRADHREQHTGQHILSQAYVRVADATTIGFHLGLDYVSIDLDRSGLSTSQHDEAFRIANEIAARDLEVRAWFPTEAELAALTLRKTPDVDGALRIVAIGDFDVSACGGTHVSRTGEVGLIHHLRSENLKRGTRVSFLAGDRARRDYASKQRIVSQVSASLSCSVAEIPDAVARLQAELSASQRELKQFREAALDEEARMLAAAARSDQGRRLLARGWLNRPAEEIRGLVLRLTNEPDLVALLGSAGDRTQLVFGRPETMALDLKPALNAALDAIGGGKGGGARVVQGGGGASTQAQLDEALQRAAAALPNG